MKDSEVIEENNAAVVTSIPFLTVFIIRDDRKYMAKCPELDLITEMDSREEALEAIVEMIGEYAEDYKAEEEIYPKSPNRAHHKPYVEMIIACQDKWQFAEEPVSGNQSEVARITMNIQEVERCENTRTAL